MLEPVITPNFSIDLYALFTGSFSASANNKAGCQEIFYTLELVSSDATTPYQFGFDLNMNIAGLPSTLESIGTYVMRVKACIMVAGTEVCQPNASLSTSNFEITVNDPCATGAIVSFPWDKPLIARQLEQDSADLAIEIPALTAGGEWPWYSAVERVVGQPVCGPIIYTITYQNGDSQSMVGFDQDGKTIVFAPSLNDAPGLYNFRLTAELTIYGITASQDFTGQVGECLPVIISNVAADYLADDLDVVWGTPMFSAPLTPLLTKYTQEPACGYPMTIMPKIAYSTSTAGYLNLPQYEV
jgi:hypothetical protein